MGLHERFPGKVVNGPEAISKIKSGSRVFLGTGCGEPQFLIRSMVENTSIQDIMVYQMLSYTLADYIDNADFLKRFSLKLFFHQRQIAPSGF